MLKKYVDKLLEVTQNADELPGEVEGAINDVLAHADSPVSWYKAPFFKDGSFSKTATFATFANVLVLVSFVLGWFQGTDLGPWTIPAFDSGASAVLLGLANGTYVINNQIKKGGT